MTLALKRSSDSDPYGSSPSLDVSLTSNARMVLEALVEASTPCKAYSLLETLRDKGVSAPMTVYRALERLVDLGYVRRIESMNAYIAIPPEMRERAIAFRICRTCSKTEFIRLDAAALNSLQDTGLLADETYIEVYHDCSGTC